MSKCSSLPGFKFHYETGKALWKPNFNQSGSYEFKIVGKDNDVNPKNDSQIFSIKVQNVNRPPQLSNIVNQEIVENKAINKIDAEDKNTKSDKDIDLNVLSYSCAFDRKIDNVVTKSQPCSKLRGAKFSLTSGQLNWTPDFFQEGSYEFKITGEDESHLNDSKIFHIKVKNFNRSPSLAKVTDQVVIENESIKSIDLKDKSSLILSLAKARPSQPKKGDDEDIDLQKVTYSCTFKESKSKEAKDCQKFLKGSTFNKETGIFDWKTSFIQEGVYSFKVIGVDNDKIDPKSDFKEFKITVLNFNRPPNLSDIVDQKIKENTAIKPIDPNDISKLVVNIMEVRKKQPDKSGPKKVDEDIDLQTITYQCFFEKNVSLKTFKHNCSSLKSLTFDPKTGKMGWHPDFSQSGDYSFKVIGEDDDKNPKNDFKTFSIKVEDVNRAPTLASIKNQQTLENKAISLIDAKDSSTNEDKDIDFDKISYSCFFDKMIDQKVEGKGQCSTLKGLKFNKDKGQLNWLPGFFQAGEYEFRIVASDGGKIIDSKGNQVDSKDEKVFSIKVKNVNRAPLLGNIDDQSIKEGEPIKLVNIQTDQKNDSDIDKEKVSYECLVNDRPCKDMSVSFNKERGILSWVPKFQQAGDYHFTITGIDSNSTGLTAKQLGGVPFNVLKGSKTFTVKVLNSNRAPILPNFKELKVRENETLTFDINTNVGSDIDEDGETVTYQCFLQDKVNKKPCSLLGIQFNKKTGFLSWKPTYKVTDSSNPKQVFNLKIKATDSSSLIKDFVQKSDTKEMAITVSNNNRPPQLNNLKNHLVYVNKAIIQFDAVDSNTKSDKDIDGENIIYSCHFDQTRDKLVSNEQECNSLSGLLFNPKSGTFSWPIGFGQEGSYEFKITGTDGGTLLKNGQKEDSLDSKIFFVKAENINKSPKIRDLASQSQTVKELKPLKEINFTDELTKTTKDVDGDKIIYTCFFDNAQDNSVTNLKNCTTISGLKTDFNKGTFNWTPASGQKGTYEFKISASDGGLTDTKLFKITVLDGIPPKTPIGWIMENPSSGSTSPKTNPIIKGKNLEKEEGSRVSVFLKSQCGDKARGHTIVKNGQFEIKNILFSEDGSDNGKKEFYGVIEDTGGNKSSCTKLSLHYNLKITPQIDHLSHRSDRGIGGSTLVIKGKAFSESGNSVQIGENDCDITKESRISISCIIPSGPMGRFSISTEILRITVSGEEINFPSGFTYTGETLLWLDVKKENSLFSDTSCSRPSVTGPSKLVKCWKDRSGHNKHAKFINGNPPVYIPDSKENNKSHLKFKSSYLRANGVDISREKVANVTVAIVFKPHNSSTKNVAIWGADNGGWDRLALLNYSYQGNKSGVSNGINGMFDTLTLKNSQFKSFISTLRSGKDFKSTVHINGWKSGASFTESKGNSSHSFFDIGSIGHSQGRFKGFIDVKEVLVFPKALTDSERITLDHYLSFKWKHHLEKIKPIIWPEMVKSKGGDKLFVYGSFEEKGNKVKIGKEICPLIEERRGRLVCKIPENSDGPETISEKDVIISIPGEVDQKIVKGLAYIGVPSLWFDGDDPRSISPGKLGSSGYVDTWLDKSGEKRHAHSSNRPRYKPQSYEGRSLLYFNGANIRGAGDHFKLRPASWEDVTNTNTGESTLFFVGRPTGHGVRPAYDRGYNANGIVGDTKAWYGLYFDNKGFRAGIDSTLCDNCKTAPRVPVSLNSFYLSTLKHQQGELSLQVDGVSSPKGFDQRTVGKIGNGGNSDQLYLGKGRDQYHHKFKGDMGEVLLYKRGLTDKETQLVQKILKKKWKFSDYPRLSSISPNMGLGKGGQEMTLYGSNFAEFGNVVTIGGHICEILSESKKEIVCKVPENPDGPKKVSTFNVVVKKPQGSPVKFPNGYTYISEAKLWLDASDRNSVSVDNKRVTEWKDKSGKNYHLTPLNGAVTYQKDSKGQYLQFGGGSLTNPGATNIIGDKKKEHGLFIVLESDPSAASWSNPLAFQRSSATDGYRLERNSDQSWVLFGSHIPSSIKINSYPLKETHLVEVMSDKQGFALVQNNKMVQQGKYKILTNKCCQNQKKCLDGSNGELQLRSCDEGEEQGWKIEYQGNGFSNIKSIGQLGKCWQFENGKLALRDCNGSASQSFKFHGSNNSFLTPKTSMVFKDRCTNYQNTTCRTWRNGSCKAYRNTTCKQYVNSSCRSYKNTSCRSYRNTSCRKYVNTSCRSYKNGSCRSWKNTSCRRYVNTSCRAWRNTSCKRYQKTSCRRWGPYYCNNNKWGVCYGYTRNCISYNQRCVDYNKTCTSYNRACADYNRACTSYNQVCSSYNRRCTSYNRVCNSYNRVCTAYNKRCNAYNKVCSTYSQVCSSYNKKCTATVQDLIGQKCLDPVGSTCTQKCGEGTTIGATSSCQNIPQKQWSSYETTSSEYASKDNYGTGGLNIGLSLNLGQRYDGTRRWKGKIREILVFDKALSFSQRMGIRNSLAKKWNIKFSEITPALSNISPKAFPSKGGSELSLKGTNFSTSGNMVKIGGKVCPIIFESSNLIKCKVPPYHSLQKIVEVPLEVINGAKKKIVLTKAILYLGDVKWWIDSEDGNSLTLKDGNKVTTWKDRSGNNNHARGVPFKNKSIQCVTVYQHSNYHGWKVNICPGNKDYNRRPWWNDNISSFRVPKGIKIKVCKDVGLRGQCAFHNRDVSWVGNPWNDVISSVQVTRIGDGDAVYPKKVKEGSKNYIQFDGVKNWLLVKDKPILGEGFSKEVDMFIYAKSESIKKSSIFASVPDHQGNRFNIHLPWSDKIVYWDFGNIRSTGRASSKFKASTSNFYRWNFISSASNSQKKIFRNDDLVHKSSTAHYFLENRNSLIDGISLGQFGNNYNYSWKGKLGEILIWKRVLSENERSLVREYLDKKWGLELMKTPTTLNLAEGLTSPSSEASPKVKVSGLGVDDKVNIFSDPGCFEKLGEQVSEDGTALVSLKRLQEGTYHFYAKSVNSKGKESRCTIEPLSYILDRTPPELKFFKIPESTKEKKVPIQIFSCSDEINIKGWQVTQDNKAPTLWQNAPPLSYDIKGGAGKYQLYGWCRDGAGNISKLKSLPVVYNRAPQLGPLGNILVKENRQMVQIDANDIHGGDKTAIGEIISYSCFYDLVVDNIVSNLSNCSLLPGVGFSPMTGIFDWKPGFNQAGPYEFKIIGAASGLSDSEVFKIKVDDINRPPKLAQVSHGVVNENTAINTIDINEETGGDKDKDGEVLSYTCQFSRIDESVSSDSANVCSKAKGLNFDSSKGLFKWTPAFDASGTWFFKVTATDGKAHDSTFFSIEVNDINLSPELQSVSLQNIKSGQVFSLDMNDKHTSSDKDRDGEHIAYTCYFDTNPDNKVAETKDCKSSLLKGMSFDQKTGVLKWSTTLKTFGIYEFKIKGQDPSLGNFDEQIFVVIVVDNSKPQVATLTPTSQTFSTGFPIEVKGGEDPNFKEFKYTINGPSPKNCDEGKSLSRGQKIEIIETKKQVISVVACDFVGNMSPAVTEVYRYIFKESSLFAHYKFNQNAGISVVDSTGLIEHNGVLNDSHRWAEDDIRGRVLDFYNTKVAFKKGDPQNFLTKPFSKRTLSFWVKPSSFQKKNIPQIIYDEGGSIYGMGLAIQNGKFLGGILYNPGSKLGKGLYKVEWSFEKEGIKKWYHITLTYNGEIDKAPLKMYVNGRLKGSVETGQSSIPYHPDERGFGGLFGESIFGKYGNNFLGQLDDVRFFSNELGLASVSALYSESTGGTPSPPKASGVIEPTHIRPVLSNIIEIKYTDINQDKAFSCQIKDLDETYFTIERACQCDNQGVCTFEVKGLGEDRSAIFKYSVKDADGDSKFVSTRISIDQTPPERPSEFSLSSKNMGPSNIKRPGIIVKNMEVGESAFLYKSDEICSDESEVGMGKAYGNEVEVQLAQESALKTEGDYTFYVKVKDAAGNESPCSENSVTYTLDLTPPPAPTGLLLGESVSSIDIMKRPLIKVEGVSSGQTVSLYKEKTCSSRFAKKESLGEVVEFRQGDFSWSLAPGDYKIYAKTVSFAGNASSCSSAKLDYTRLALPNELSTSDDPLEFSLWLDPSLSLNSNIETVSGGTEVEVLNDMSGKENSFQTLGPRLFYKTNGAGIGGKNTLYSDQTDFRRLSSNKENFKFLHDNSTSYTIGIFVRSDCTKAYCALFGNNSGTRRKRGIGLGIDERSPNKGQLWFSISDGSDFNLQLKTPNNSITKGKGSFIIVEFKGSEAAVYVNNTLKKVQKAFSGRPYSNKEASYDIHLGGHPKRILSNGVCQNCSLSQFKAWSFKGHIGDVLIYKNILTPSQKLELYDYMSRKWDIRK